jgi:hypothetical protein
LTELVSSFWNSTFPTLIPQEWKSTKTLRITNQNDGIFSFITLKDVVIHVGVSINDDETALISNSSDELKFGDSLEGYFNLSELMSGIIESTFDVLTNLTVDFMLSYSSNSSESNMFDQIIGDVLTDIFEIFNIALSLDIGGMVHYFGASFTLDVYFSDIINSLLNTFGGVMG